MELIYVLPSGEQDFSDNQHMENFTKYLFSNSKTHQKNDNTDKNFYMMKEKNNFVENNIKNLEEFSNIYLKNYKSEDYFMDLHYIAFLIPIDNIIYTNILDMKNNEHILTIPNEIIEEISNEYYKNNVKNFEKDMNNLLEKFDGKIQKFDNTNKEIKKIIELKLHKIIYKLTNHKLLLSISHNDQEFYHIHRILKNY
jgi:hypothetical protein